MLQIICITIALYLLYKKFTSSQPREKSIEMTDNHLRGIEFEYYKCENPIGGIIE